MCGIIGIIGRAEVADFLVEGLKRLEYRGYDSAGVATLVDGRIERRRAEGKLDRLIERLQREPVTGRIGIAHTRWATHGVPNETNAHPIATDRVAVVHNGIIENFQELKDELVAEGYRFETQTDTEAVAILLTHHLRQGLSPREAAAKVFPRLEGAFALTILFAGEPDLLICARRSSPLAIGFGDGEMFLGSDALALAPLTRRILYLEEGDWAVVTAAGATVYDRKNREAKREIRETALSGALIGKGNHRHFMEKEIFEQPVVIGDALMAHFHPTTRTVHLPSLHFDLAAVPKIGFIACGTAYHAGLIAKYWIERWARLPVDAEIASEFRYRMPAMPKGGLAVFVSQSGETLDTLAALRYAKEQGQHILAVVNQPESTVAREAGAVLATHAGPEIGVASTKAFTTQLAVLACFTLAVARARGTLGAQEEAALSTALTEVPARANDVLQRHHEIQKIAAKIAEARDVLYLGRGTSFPLALIDEKTPVVVLAPRDELFEKTASNIQEVLARGGKVVMISDKEGLARFGGKLFHGIEVPPCHPFVAPLLYSVPVQLLAYDVAVLKGTDVDQPRNLAKSVTVE